LPALLKRTSMAPNFATVRSTYLRVAAASLTSAATASTFGLCKLGGRALEVAVREIDQHDARALAQEQLRVGKAEAARAAGDDADLVGEKRHGLLRGH
jgi:hypothetical protein